MPFRRGRVLFWHEGVNRVHSSVGWMRISIVGVLKVRHREYARSGNWTRPCSFMPLSSVVAAGVGYLTNGPEQALLRAVIAGGSGET